MRYFIEFAYRGTHYHGSQVQPNGITVQQVLEQAFHTILRQPVALTFAGRTDAGVHAEQMFAHFDLDITPPTPDRLNRLLPQDIAVSRIFPVADDTHARFSAVSRTYEYRICTRKSPFAHDLRTYVPGELDYTAMNEAAALLLGTHDFASFCKVHTDVKTTVCTVTEASWRTDDDGRPLSPEHGSCRGRHTDGSGPAQIIAPRVRGDHLFPVPPGGRPIRTARGTVSDCCTL